MTTTPSPPYNPWREFIENCINGDNYFRASEYQDILDDIDGLTAELAREKRGHEHYTNEWSDACNENQVLLNELAALRSQDGQAARTQPTPPADRVQMPANADQAVGMVLLGEAWLREHAPDRLKAQPAPVVPAWQPIETAPKDRRVLLGREGYPWVFVGAWSNTYEHWSTSSGAMDFFASPTHWAESPAAPQPLPLPLPNAELSGARREEK